MFASPSKRRKTSPTTAIGVNADNTQSGPSTPKRASFQAPTQSSLARSHPNLVRQTAESERSGGKRRSLRHEVLGRRPSNIQTQGPAEPSVTSTTPEQQGEVGKDLVNAAATSKQRLSGAIAKTFANGPPKLPRSRQPLLNRQPPVPELIDPLQDAYLETDHLSSGHRQRERKKNEKGEPELPPTPVDLGLAKPDRPRGLASSSPRSGSGRKRNTSSNVVTSSPLKRKLQAPEQSQAGLRGGGPASRHVPEEPASSDVEQEVSEETVEEAAEMSKKRSTRDKLRSQLNHLQADMARLEELMQKNEDAPDEIWDPVLAQLLTAKNVSCDPDYKSPTSRSSSPSLPWKIDLGPSPMPFLTLFAPGSFQLDTQTSTSSINEQLHQVFTFILSSSGPYPPHAFGAQIRVLANAETQSVRSIELVKLTDKTEHVSLTKWIDQRLDSQLHRLDVSGLVWGMGKYWEACRNRAMVWMRMDAAFNGKGGTLLKDVDEKAMTPAKLRTLMTHHKRTSMTFDIESKAARSKKGSKEKNTTKVLLKWELDLDWVGEVVQNLDLTTTGLPKKANAGAKKVFASIAAEDPYAALETVLVSVGKEVGT